MEKITWSKEDLITLLIEHDLEQFYDNDDPGHIYAYILRKGRMGYEEMDLEDLIDEAIDRDLIDEDTLEVL